MPLMIEGGGVFSRGSFFQRLSDIMEIPKDAANCVLRFHRCAGSGAALVGIAFAPIVLRCVRTLWARRPPLTRLSH